MENKNIQDMSTDCTNYNENNVIGRPENDKMNDMSDGEIIETIAKEEMKRPIFL